MYKFFVFFHPSIAVTINHGYFIVGQWNDQCGAILRYRRRKKSDDNHEFSDAQ